jgi:hypothetical protein
LLSTSAKEVGNDAPPSKKMKRSHTTPSLSPTSARSVQPKYEHTPPPSPGAPVEFKVDTDGINDDIVVGVIQQLEKTGNRPHLVKELAAILAPTVGIVSRYDFVLLSSPLSNLPSC